MNATIVLQDVAYALIVVFVAAVMTDINYLALHANHAAQVVRPVTAHILNVHLVMMENIYQELHVIHAAQIAVTV